MSPGKHRMMLFVSYSHKDSVWLEELRPHLKSLAIEKDFDTFFWDDTQIMAGTDWKAEIYEALNFAKVAILLISKHFLSSDFITSNELPPLLTAAKQKKTVILPIILSPCRFKYHPQLSAFQSVNPPSDPIEGMTKVNYENTFLKVTELIDEAFAIPGGQVAISGPSESNTPDLPVTVSTLQPQEGQPAGEIFNQPEISLKKIPEPVGHSLSVPDENWARLIIQSLPDGSLHYQTIHNNKRLESSLYPPQRRLVDDLAEKCLTLGDFDRQLARALFEMLIPNDLKSILFQTDGTILILDSTTARYPWELLLDSANGNDLPISVRHPVIRQPITYRFTPHSRTTKQKALIIGDPDVHSYVPQLPGARKEADQIANLFRNSGFTVNSQIGATAREIITALFSESFQILHMAGHGVYEYRLADTGRTVTGFLLGKDLFFTGYEVSQMSTAPDIVFLNAPYLGRHTSASQSNETESSIRYTESLPGQFISIGSRAIIAPAGTLNDFAAGTFATTFYEAMFNGMSFGQAVLAARKKTYLLHTDSNTFGMYLCYGDPGYRLTNLHHVSAIFS
jgi:CHAT domain-containing protein